MNNIAKKIGRFFNRLKKIAQPPSAAEQQNNFDKKLVFSLVNSRLPDGRQLSQLAKILSARERLAIKILGLTITVCLVIMAANFYLHNVEYLPQAGGEYTEGLIGAPRYLNPILAQTNDVDRDICQLIFAGLFKYNQHGELIPDLADSYSVSDDQKVYNIKLKNNLKWHDGEPLTVDDIIYTVAMIQDPEFKSPLLVSFKGVGVEKADAQTVKFVLSDPFAPFLGTLIFGILPEHLWSSILSANAILAEYNLKPTGAGPYKFSSLTKDRSGNIREYILTVNENYHGQLPYLKNINFKFYPDFDTATEALASKKTQGISFLPKGLKEKVTRNKNLAFYSLHLPQYTAIFFNQKNNEFLRDKKIREALAYALNKEKIIQETMAREGDIIHGPILPGLIGYNPEIKKYNYNPAEANQILDDKGFKRIEPAEYQQLMAEKKQKEEAAAEKAETTDSETTTELEPAGTANPPADGELPPEPPFYRQKNNQFLTVKLTAVNQPESLTAAKLVLDYWQAIGVKVNLEIVDGYRIQRELIKPRQYEALLYSEILGSDPDPYAFWHSSQNQAPGVNLAVFSDRNVDKLLEDARQTNDNQKREEYYQKFQDILADQLPAIFLYNPTYTYAVSQEIKGLDTQRIAVPADRFANITNWYIKTKVRFKKNNSQ
ncbi:MAG: peptide ABC transporter substrate-binding protein [bacterium]